MSNLVETEVKLLPAFQYTFITALIILFAVASYWYIPNKVPEEKRQQTQLYTTVAYTVAYGVIASLTYLNAMFQRPATIIRKTGK
jgi:uncharacterized membrane protein YedE/YeeE